MIRHIQWDEWNEDVQSPKLKRVTAIFHGWGIAAGQSAIIAEIEHEQDLSLGESGQYDKAGPAYVDRRGRVVMMPVTSHFFQFLDGIGVET